MAAWLSLSLLIVSSILIIAQKHFETIGIIDTGVVAALIALTSLLSYFCYRFLLDYRKHLINTFQSLFLGAVIAFSTFGTYIYSSELLNVAQNVKLHIQYFGSQVFDTTPKRTFRKAHTTPNKIVRINRRRDGHFVVKGSINNTVLDFIIDTGATTVVLRYEDAGKIGIDVTKLKFIRPVRTANGKAYAAYIKLQHLFIGPLKARNIDAFVLKPRTLQKSLLGMSFLGHLKSYEFAGQFLTLRQ
ncbi:MAG: TIGR02281 family clan AA aspartic protease [Pseudomonadota bacterium]